MHENMPNKYNFNILWQIYFFLKVYAIMICMHTVQTTNKQQLLELVFHLNLVD